MKICFEYFCFQLKFIEEKNFCQIQDGASLAGVQDG
jgi:hypothetical protein